MVEFVMDDEDVVESRDDIERIDRLLIEAQTEDSDHGSESASTGAEQAASNFLPKMDDMSTTMRVKNRRHKRLGESPTNLDTTA